MSDGYFDAYVGQPAACGTEIPGRDCVRDPACNDVPGSLLGSDGHDDAVEALAERYLAGEPGVIEAII